MPTVAIRALVYPQMHMAFPVSLIPGSLRSPFVKTHLTTLRAISHSAAVGNALSGVLFHFFLNLSAAMQVDQCGTCPRIVWPSGVIIVTTGGSTGIILRLFVSIQRISLWQPWQKSYECVCPSGESLNGLILIFSL